MAPPSPKGTPGGRHINSHQQPHSQGDAKPVQEFYLFVGKHLIISSKEEKGLREAKPELPARSQDSRLLQLPSEEINYSHSQMSG